MPGTPAERDAAGMNNALTRSSRAAPARLALPVLLGVGALGFAVASAIHFGLPLGPLRDPFPGARVPEAVLAVLLAAACIYTLARGRGSRWVALTAVLVSLLGVGVGLTITVPAALWGDVVYHLAAAALLVVTALVAVRA
ncbi:MAG: hypothetical protein J2P38_04790 [Candidatus Dormibacteraeota bacterium]|nr:hypothetical protein [Candidatus Dormibacteraeota bacterium]